MGLFMAARANNRMGARQQYRTMARMQRRRSAFQNSTGAHQDFTPREEEGQEQTPQQAQAEQQTTTDYSTELEQLAQLMKKGIITDEEYSAKKKQILGI